MRKWWLLLLVLVCTIFAGCKKNTEKDKVVEEIDIPGVKVEDLTDAYEYSYSEQQDGSLLFAIKGKWESNQTWEVTYEQDVIAEVTEVAQSNKEAKFEFSSKEGKGGYSEYYIELYDTTTEEKQYTFVVSIMLSQDNKKISVLNILFYEPSEETVNEETTEEEIKEDTEETSEHIKTDFEAVVGNIQLSKEAEVLDVAIKEYADREDGKKVGEMRFTYEGKEFSCIIAPNIPLSYFQKQIEKDKYTQETQYIDEVEVIIYSIDGARMILWKNKDNICYVLTEKKNSGEIGLKAVEMLIEKN